MKKLGKFAVLFSLTLALAATVVFAQTGTATSGAGMGKNAERGRHGHHHELGFGFAKLNLTDAQKTGMKQIRENHNAAISALREQIRAKRKDLRQADSEGSFSEALATQKLGEMAPLKAKLMAEEFAMHQEVINLLTPEQKAQLAQMRTEWKAKRAGHRNTQG